MRFAYSENGPYVSYRRRKGCMATPAQRLAFRTWTECYLEPEEDDYKAVCFGICLIGREYELFVRDNGLE